ncbi:ArsR/SmtB family transcription factor [Nocardioides sp. NPDC057767]|uniref:ArsR/SmtB family transcription factor n=1 Tax=unclassified Nocardioides TaxID=2615069 RepID=UPI00366F2326
MSTDFRTPAPDAALQRALDAVGDPVRRSILRQLAAAEPWTIACGQFDLPVGKSTLTHHFRFLVEAGLLEQRDEGNRRMNRLMREEFDRQFPGLLDLVLQDRSAT